MQGKSLVKFLLILLVLICIVQCSFMLPTRKAEAAADQYAEQIAQNSPESDRYAVKKQARLEYIDSISGEEIFSIPLLKSYTYDELKKQQLALGLDLKGGHSATLQVDLKEMLVNLAGGTKDPTFLAAWSEADVALANSQSDYITLFAQAFRNQQGDKDLSRFFYKKLSEDINIKSADGEVITVLRRKADETVGLTFDLLKQRIDKLGVAQPNISLDAGRDLIQVELPGIESPERARNMLNASAKLEFWNTYRVTDAGIASALRRADEILKSKADGTSIDPSVPQEIAYDTIWQPAYDEDGNVTGDSIPNIIEKQTDDFGNQGPLTTLLNLNGADGQYGYASTVMGIADKNKKKAVDALLADPDVAALFPRDSKFMWSKAPYSDYETKIPTKQYELYLIKTPASGKPLLEGGAVTQASQGPDPTTGEVKVNLSMNQKGARIWADMTTKAAQQGNREVALSLDDEVISAPRVNGPIPGGRTEISGNFSIAEASDLSNMLEIGKLPATVKTIQESTVGPSLGQENINKSFISLVAGVSLLVIFLLLYYGGAGVVSIITLLLNLFFIFGALASFGTVLTLPGVAGIILTIGMAVDANVIIFERIKEELRSGKSMLASISDGFKHSYSAIIDANVTTMLVAFVLFYFGLGPIKGFAVVLMIGVLCSVFTAVLVGRLIFDWWTTSRGKNISFWNGFSKNMFANMQVDWIGKRKIAYVISGTLIIVGLISMFTKGFDLGVDFKGGYSYNVQFDQSVDVDPEAIRDGLAATFGEVPIVKSVDTENTFNIVTSYLINDNTEGAQEKVLTALFEGINGMSGGNMNVDNFKNIDSQAGTHVISSSKVGPTIADDIKWSSIYAGVIALLLIFLYIFIRFNKWQYSLGAVAALFHDSLVVLGIFSLLYNILPISMQIDQAFIAAILTVIGYSINDTVVVFDRIREYLGIYTERSTDEILNLAINSTFSRTVITSLTTLLVVVILLIFGGDSIKGFALALMIGIIVGTYSSIFVATPIVRDLSDELKVRKKETKKSSFSRATSKA